jgi:hypothetical protein
LALHAHWHAVLQLLVETGAKQFSFVAASVVAAKVIAKAMTFVSFIVIGQKGTLARRGRKQEGFERDGQHLNFYVRLICYHLGNVIQRLRDKGMHLNAPSFV